MKYEILKVNGCSYILSDFKRISNEFPQPNFRKTGKALAGVLGNGQTLKDWLLERNTRSTVATDNTEEAYKLYRKYSLIKE